MQYILDAAVILLVALSVYHGVKKGFVKTAFGLVATAAALIIASNFSPLLCEFVKETPAYTSIKDSVNQKVSQSLNEAIEQSAGDVTRIKNFDEIANLLSKAGVDSKELSEQYNQMLSGTSQALSDFTDNLIVTPIADMLCSAACFLLLFFASVIAINIVISLLDLVAKLPILHGVNKLLGALLGALYGALKVFILCTAVNIVLLYFTAPQIGFVSDVGSKTYLFKIFENLNPLSFLY